jgi:hypothetical protein
LEQTLTVRVRHRPVVIVTARRRPVCSSVQAAHSFSLGERSERDMSDPCAFLLLFYALVGVDVQVFVVEPLWGSLLILIRKARYFERITVNLVNPLDGFTLVSAA